MHKSFSPIKKSLIRKAFKLRCTVLLLFASCILHHGFAQSRVQADTVRAKVKIQSDTLRSKTIFIANNLFITAMTTGSVSDSIVTIKNGIFRKIKL